FEPVQRFAMTREQVTGLRFAEEKSIRSALDIHPQFTAGYIRIGTEATFRNGRDETPVRTVVQTQQQIFGKCVKKRVMAAFFKNQIECRARAAKRTVQSGISAASDLIGRIADEQNFAVFRLEVRS